MIQNLSSAMEADQDLHIAKHVESENLPAMIQPIMKLAQSDGERDMLLLSLLTAAGSCMPNLYFRYGLNCWLCRLRKRYCELGVGVGQQSTRSGSAGHCR